MSKIDNRKAVAAEVRAAAGHAGMKQVDLARSVPMARQTLSQKWRGKVAFTVDELIAIAKALGIPPSQLLPTSERGMSRAEDHYKKEKSNAYKCR